jgi:hypothetical protein
MGVTAGVQPAAFADGEPAEVRAIVRALFEQRTGDGMDALADEQRLSIEAADQRFTRIRALIDRVLGVSP